MPPAPLDQRPSHPPNTIEDDSSDEDDDFGPALPTGDAISNDNDDHTQNAVSDAPQAEEKLKRDDWMMMPPKQDDLAARMDPSVQRPRGFNTGKGAKAPNTGGDDSSIWHETPEQKRKRLADEMMGVGTTSMTTRPNPVKISKKTGAHEKIQEHIVSVWAMQPVGCTVIADNDCRRRHEGHLSWINMRRRRASRQKTIPASEHSIARRTWEVEVVYRRLRSERCSTRLLVSRTSFQGDRTCSKEELTRTAPRMAFIFDVMTWLYCIAVAGLCSMSRACCRDAIQSAVSMM